MKWLLRIGIAVALFVLGWIVGQITEYIDFFHLSLEVPLFNVINLIVVSFLGWYISYIIQTTQRKTKSKVDIYSNVLDDIDSSLLRLTSQVRNANGAYYPEIISLDKCVRKWYNHLYDSFDEDLKKTFPDTLDHEIREGIASLRKLMTGSPISQTQGSPVLIVNNIVKYDNQRISEVEATIDSVRYSLYNMKLKISQI